MSEIHLPIFKPDWTLPEIPKVQVEGMIDQRANSLINDAGLAIDQAIDAAARAEQYRDQASEIAGLPAADEATAFLVGSQGSQTRGALDTAMSDRVIRVGGQYDLARYGDVREAVLVGNASMTAGSPRLSVGSHPFTTADIGKVVGVRGAGVVSDDYSASVANDGVLVGTIASLSGGDAILNTPAVTTCSGVPAIFGFPVDSALAAAIAACTAGGGGTIRFPVGRYIVVASPSYSSYVSFAGAGMYNTEMYVTKIVPVANNPVTSGWLRTQQGRSVEVNLSDFTANGSFFACAAGYGADMKMIHVSATDDSTVERFRSVNNPSTALGYDGSTGCVIANNRFINPGRLAQVIQPGDSGGPGGSGIGIAIGSGRELSYVIRDNFIEGLATSMGGAGRSGINIENSMDNIPGHFNSDVRIINNYITGMSHGVVVSGGQGILVDGNTIRGCHQGIRIGTNGIGTGGAARDAIVTNNLIEHGISAPGNTSVGITVTTSGSSSAHPTEGRTKIVNNVVRGNQGVGIRVNGATHPLNNVDVRGNGIFENGAAGIELGGTVHDLSVVGNKIAKNGRIVEPVQNRNAAIRATSTLRWHGGRIQGNDYSDLADTPTQDNAFRRVSGAQLYGVLDDSNPSAADVLYARKSTTTTLNNQPTSVTISSFSLQLETGPLYELTVMLSFSTAENAGLVLGFITPAGTVMRWAAHGAGVTDMRMLAAGNTLSLPGGEGTRVVTLHGTINVPSNAALQLTARQDTPRSTDTIITTNSVMWARKLTG